MAGDQVLSTVNKNVCIIVLNWNGWQDTIECLESVSKLDYSSFQVIVVDNGSDDDSVKQINNWAAGKVENIETKFPHLVFPLTPKPLNLVNLKDLLKHPEQELTKTQKMAKWFFVQMEENVGFARGMNLAINFALSNLQCDYFYLLNNDTVLEPNTLSGIIKAFEMDKEIAAAQSTIYYYSDPQHIANAGGRILPWGQTKYYRNIKPNEIKRITFINGCAMCLPRRTIEKHGKLTEKFFFGEEDFEFSMRARKQGFKLVAVGGSRVYHKIGASSEKHWEGNARRVLVFGLNRLVDMRTFYSFIPWNFWRIFSTFYFGVLLVSKYRTPINFSLQIIMKIFKYSKKLDRVGKNDIEAILNEK